MTQPRDNAETYAHAEALRGAIEHVRAAKGVLDSYPPTQRAAQDVEIVAQKLEKQLEPLNRLILADRARVNRA